MIDGMPDTDRSKWYKREIEFYRRELAGLKFMFDQQRQMLARAQSQGGQPGSPNRIMKGYPRQIPPNMTPEQIAQMIVPPAGKTAEDLEKEGVPEGMPEEVFKLVIKRMRDNPDSIP